MTRHPMLLATLLPAALLLPATALADDGCRHSRPERLAIDATGARTIEFHVGPGELRLDGAPGTKAALDGRACASSAEELGRLRIEQSREGDRLVVRLVREERSGWNWGFGNRYARFELAGTVPEDVRVVVSVGSGEVRATGLAELGLTVGSGDAEARAIRGRVDARVGSGDITLADIGSLDAGSVGSGDLAARHVRGNARVGSIGSGDAGLGDVGGDVEIGSIGSGDAELVRIAGSVDVGSIGSGDLDVDGVGGDLRVHAQGSGSVEHHGVKGRVELPRKR